MKEMKENVFFKKMYREVLNNGFDLVMDYRDCFRDEMCDISKEETPNYFDFRHYSNDMLDDCLLMLRQLNDLYTHDNYIDYDMALKITKWYESVDTLLCDFRNYLLREYHVLWWDRIETYKENKGE